MSTLLASPHRTNATGVHEDGSSSSDLIRLAAIACLLGAEVIHMRVMDAHFAEWWAAGAFFLAISVTEGLLAGALLLKPSRRLALLAVAVSVATMVTWVTSRSAGLPFGPTPGVPEPPGRADAIATAFELATAALLITWLVVLTDRKSFRVGSRHALGLWACVLAVVTLTGVAVTPPVDHEVHHAHTIAPLRASAQGQFCVSLKAALPSARYSAKTLQTLTGDYVPGMGGYSQASEAIDAYWAFGQTGNDAGFRASGAAYVSGWCQPPR